jgi:hypothetical protein
MTDIRSSFYSTAYSVDDIAEYWLPQSKKIGIADLAGLAASSRHIEEKFLEHAIFGRGKIVNSLGNDKYIVDFIEKGEKTIDASIAPVTFL